MARIFLSLLALLMLTAAPLRAQDAAGVVTAQILPGWQLADGRHMAGLQIDLAPGWKTYWRAPGDAGIPPQFDWSGSRNLDKADVRWPTPKPILQNGVMTIGYADAVILPLHLTPHSSREAIQLRASIEMGVCKEVCVPVTLKVAQDLPAGQTKPDPRIAAALADRPYTAAEAGVTRVACTVWPIRDGLRLRAEVEMPAMDRREIAVIESDNPQLWVSQASVRRKGQRLLAEAEVYHIEGRTFALDRSGLTLTVLGKGHAVEIQGCPAG